MEVGVWLGEWGEGIDEGVEIVTILSLMAADEGKFVLT